MLKQVSLFSDCCTKWVIQEEKNVVKTVLFLPCVFSSHGLVYMSCSSPKHGESVCRGTWDGTGQNVKMELSR